MVVVVVAVVVTVVNKPNSVVTWIKRMSLPSEISCPTASLISLLLLTSYVETCLDASPFTVNDFLEMSNGSNLPKTSHSSRDHEPAGICTIFPVSAHIKVATN